MIDPLHRVLVLVPHDPDLDPRVLWSIGLCRRLGRTEVIAATWATTKPAKAYDGIVSIERVDASTNCADLARRLAAFGNRLDIRLITQEYRQRQGRRPDGVRSRSRHAAGGVFRWFAAWSAYAVLVTALYRRASVVGVKPRIILAHDLYALIPAILLKRGWQCRVVYDTHEYFPASDLLAPRWQSRLTRIVERWFIRQADRVVTVSPPLAAQLREDYGVRDVIVVPNVEPRRSVRAEPPADGGDRVRFLLQGQVAPGRGIERLLDLWETVDDPRALLQIRAPEWDFPIELRERYADLERAGRVEWPPAVREDELVAAAATASVGLIPYVRPNKNHLFASPNKLSQYMCAGIPILANDLPYVASVLHEYGCGLVYDADDPTSFTDAVTRLTENAELRRLLGRNGAAAAADTYNWDVRAVPYGAALQELFDA